MNLWTILVALLVSIAALVTGTSQNVTFPVASTIADINSAGIGSPATSYAQPISDEAALQLVGDAMRRQATSYPMRMIISGLEGPPLVVSEMESPERLYFGIGDMGVIVYDGVVYERKKGQWSENEALAPIADLMIANSSPEYAERKVANLISATWIAEETLEGDVVDVFEVIADDPEDELGQVTTLMSIRRSDGLPVYTVTTEGAPEAARVELEYDPNIRVLRPVP